MSMFFEGHFLDIVHAVLIKGIKNGLTLLCPGTSLDHYASTTALEALSVVISSLLPFAILIEVPEIFRIQAAVF